jgi:hypothetical protein
MAQQNPKRTMPRVDLIRYQDRKEAQKYVESLSRKPSPDDIESFSSRDEQVPAGLVLVTASDAQLMFRVGDVLDDSEDQEWQPRRHAAILALLDDYFEMMDKTLRALLAHGVFGLADDAEHRIDYNELAEYHSCSDAVKRMVERLPKSERPRVTLNLDEHDATLSGSSDSAGGKVEVRLVNSETHRPAVGADVTMVEPSRHFETRMTDEDGRANFKIVSGKSLLLFQFERTWRLVLQSQFSNLSIVKRGPLVLDPVRNACTWSGSPLALNSIEFIILETWGRGSVDSTDQLVDALSGEFRALVSAYLYVTIRPHIERLSEKIRFAGGTLTEGHPLAPSDEVDNVTSNNLIKWLREA